MTTKTQKIGTINQTYQNAVKSKLAVLYRQNKNTRKKLFQASKRENYRSKRSFVNQWKPYFPINVINNKWRKMSESTPPKRSNPFKESLGSLFS